MPADAIRNVAFLGTSDSGKTTLLEALAFHFGALKRQGSVAEGTTVCDFSPESIAKKHSLQAAVVHIEGPFGQLNLVDTPGYPDFLADAVTAMGAAGAVVLTLAARNDSVPFHARRLWKLAGDAGCARAVVVTKADQENLDLERIVRSIREALGKSVVPFTLPNQTGAGFSSVHVAGDQDGPWHQMLVDAVVEADDALMERYLESGAVSDEELERHMPIAMEKGTLVPLFFVNPLKGIGVKELDEFMVKEFPTAGMEPPSRKLPAVAGGRPDERLVALAWKVTTDKHLGQITYLRVLQGSMKPDMQVVHPHGGKGMKLTGLSSIFGKELRPVAQAGPGAIVAVTRVEDLRVGDVIVSEGSAEPHAFPLPEPFNSLAVRPKSRNDEQKISGELHKIAKEDPTFRVRREPSTHEMICDGLSELHLHTCLARVEARGVGVETSIPRIAYQETVTGKAEGHYRHKKQTGGSGQFGEAYIRLYPNTRGGGFEFLDEVTGGAIPRQFIPAVEKGVVEQMQKGIIASSQVVDIKVELYDGKYHEVDSDEISFKISGARALQDAFLKARPILLEPIMEVEIAVPSRFFGDVSGDLNTRRGRILGMETDGDFQVIKANVPLAEMQGYATPLRSMTAGEGSFSMRFDHYDQVPSYLQEKLVAELGAHKEAVKEHA
ncbi:MAG: elongation factor G [Planctomycetota bacterium]|nr:MAG: elongation factor G [Planctomycetota bacterium]